MNREAAEVNLKHIFELNSFYDDQWSVIHKLFNGERILLIEKTGYGKSLCYQFPATQLEGLTIVFSPLLALMRDQIKFLASHGIAARSINSEQTEDENEQVIQDAIQNKIKILYIAPERQENRDWLDAVRNIKISMVVIDEAHCISVWGHDFRPAYRRIINLVKLIPQNFPVLATTATATQRVANDIIEQIGGKISLIRGNLLRDNFQLNVIRVKNENEKLEWLGEMLPKFEGSGLIYTGTRNNTEIFSKWLQYIGISSINYNAGLEAASRIEIEKGFMDNRWKCVVATNALGMGIDKPDIRFIIHTQFPGSPIHYYQEIGRAGRDGKKTTIYLLYNPDDVDLQNAFIDGSKPSIKNYFKVIDALKKEPLGEHDLMRKTNLKQTQIRVIRADLLDQGIIKEVLYGRSKKYEYQFNAPQLDTKRFEELREFKRKELSHIIEYADATSCRMNFLCSYLGDKSVGECNKCDNDQPEIFRYDFSKDWQKRIDDFWNNFFPILEVETNSTNLTNGVAGSYYGVSNVGSLIHKCKYENGGDFPDFLVKLTAKAFRYHFKSIEFHLIVYVPPTESHDLVKIFAQKISNELKIPISHKLKKIKRTEPQKVFQNSILKKDNIKDAFVYENPSELINKNILIIDDIFDSGNTIKEIGRMLSKLGSEIIAPLVIAKTVGGNLNG